jgi:hypothetical protein
MSELESLGVQIAKREKLTSSTSINGMELSSSTTTKLVLALPKEVPLKLSLSKEGFGRKLVKLFKKELQTGDKTFDDAIFIATETSDAAATFLSSDDVRQAIYFCVAGAGPVEIDANMVTLEVPGDDDSVPREVITIVRALLA